jgi:hypothetical protein
MTDQQADEIVTHLRMLNGKLNGIALFLLGILVCFVILLLRMR